MLPWSEQFSVFSCHSELAKNLRLKSFEFCTVVLRFTLCILHFIIMSKLLLVESPTKVKTLKKFLDKSYKIAATVGHIRDLPKNKLGVEIENNFEPKYVIPVRAKRVIQSLKQEAKKAKTIILACDQDREGEAISWHLVYALELEKLNKPYQRIVFHEITETAIKQALKNPGQIDMNLVSAQQARRILDRIVGYKLSPFLRAKLIKGLSAGRVQSVAVRLVVEKEREIEKFVPQEYWLIEALLRQQIPNSKFQTPNKSKIQNPKLETGFKASLVKKDGETIPKFGINTKKQAEKIVKDLEGAEYKIVKIKRTEKKRNPLPPFKTSTLQQTAGMKFRWTPNFIMRMAQQLYENGLITYHRTDSFNLSDLSLFAAKKFIITNYSKEYWAGFLRKYKTKAKGAQEAHEAIRPTDPNKIPEEIKSYKKVDEKGIKLYSLIWQRFIASQMSQARFDSTKVEIEANPKLQITNSKQILNSKYIFRTTGQILKFDGFLKVYPIKYEETELPFLEEDEALEFLKLIPNQHFTQPPARYSEVTLIKMLEENGIGRPSTYAPIISVIQNRNYVSKNKDRRFQPTEIGIMVNDLLVEHFPEIVSLKFTAEMEEKLDEVAQGKMNRNHVLNTFWTSFEKNLKEKESQVPKEVLVKKITNKKCPKCGADLVNKLGRFGRFYACSNFPDCKYTESLNNSNLGIKCPLCGQGDIIEKRTRKGKTFYACNKYPDCDFALWDKPTGELCKNCGALLIKTLKGKVKCSKKECFAEEKLKLKGNE